MPAISQFVPRSEGKSPPPKPASSGFVKGVASVAPPPPANTVASGVGGMSAGTLRAVNADVPRPNGDIQSSGAGYNSAKANAFKRTAAYRKAIVETFLHQPAAQRAVIAKAAFASNTPEAKIISGLFRAVGPDVTSVSGDPLAAIAGSTSGTGGLGIVKNAFSDAVNLPAQTIQGLASLTSQVAQGHVGHALGMLVDPYVHLFEHPSDFLHHPLDTALLFGGPETAVGRVGGDVARSGALGERLARAARTERAPLRLGRDIAGAPSPIVESRSYSPNLITKAVQRGHEGFLHARGFEPNVARPKPRAMPRALANSLNVGLEAKTRVKPNEMVAVRQMEGKESRTETGQKINAARPHKTVQNVVAHILQGVIRTPETAVEDITKEINRLKAAQTGKRTFKEFANRAQVRDLSTALKNQRHLPAAFTAANTLRDIFHKQDAEAVTKGIIDPAQAHRSRLLSYAQAHMGAKYDHVGSLPSDDALRFRAARTLEQDTRRTVKANEGKLAKAQQREAAVTARIKALRGGSRGRTDLSARPLPRDMFERLSKVQRARAAAEDALNKSKSDLRDARHERVALQHHEHETLGPAFVHANGDRLPTEEILNHIEAHGVPEPAYVGHYPAKQAAYRFYQAWKAARGHLSGATKTGEAFRSGGYDHTFDALIAQGARTTEALTKAGLHDRIVNRLGIGKPKAMQTGRNENGYFTPAEARAMQKASVDDFNNHVPGSQPLTPLTAFDPRTPFSLIHDVQSPSELEYHSDQLELKSLERALDDARTRNDSVRNVVMVPEHAMDQFRKQFKPAGEGARRLGQVTQQFRRTVLPYSTHWMMQIGSEAVIRGLVAGVTDPRSIVAGHQVMRALKDSAEGRNAAREMVNATFYNRNDPLAKFNPYPSPTREFIRHTPAELVIAAHNRYANFIGHAMGSLEHEFRVMALGKLSRRQVSEFTRSYQLGVKLQGQNLALLVDKLKTDPELVAKFGRQVDDIFGKYNKLSPAVRAATQTWAPFLPWYLNAAKFVLWNLPVKHPVASSLLASVRLTLAQDIANGKQEPLNAYQEQALAKLSPFGILPQAAEGEGGPLGQLAAISSGAILPQAAGAYNALHGQNAFGDSPLYGPAGVVKAFSGGAIGASVEAALEAVLPMLRDVRIAREGGGTSYGTSTLINPQAKPGTGGGAVKILNRIFNPLHAFESAGSAGTGASSSGAGSWGGAPSTARGWG